MVTDIEIIVNSSIIVSMEVSLLLVKNHAILDNLDYAHSGHTGFASTEDLNNGLALKANIADIQRDYVQWNNVSQYATDWSVVQRKQGGYVDVRVNDPVYWDEPANKNYVDNKQGELFRNNRIKAELIPDEFDEVMEFEKEVSGASFIDATLATEVGSIVWCAATKPIAGDTYYRKFIVNNDGTQAGLTTIDPAKGKLYVGKTANNLFGWSGSNLLEISKSLSLGETSTTAYAGNKGKANAQAIVQLQTDVAGKQDTLVSGTNIKTINGVNVLGSGDVTVPGQPLTKIFKYATNVAFTQEEITMLKSLQAYVQLSYGGGSSAGQRNYFPVSNNRYGSNELVLGSITGTGGFYVMTINTTDGTWSESYTRISSAIYRHEITVPAQTWYYQNSSTTYITKIIFYSKVQAAITNTDELFNFFRDNDINDGKVCFSDGTHNGCMGLHFYINPAAGYRKIANLQGTNANYWYNAPSTAYSLTDTVTIY